MRRAEGGQPERAAAETVAQSLHGGGVGQGTAVRTSAALVTRGGWAPAAVVASALPSANIAGSAMSVVGSSELRESANGNNQFSSMLLFTLDCRE
ncbi:unnamed protein product [Boreogadus saida]